MGKKIQVHELEESIMLKCSTCTPSSTLSKSQLHFYSEIENSKIHEE